MTDLSASELRWVEDRGAAVFGLTPKQSAVLLAVLARETFSYQEIADAVQGKVGGMTRQGVQVALGALHKRDIVTVTKLPRGFEARIGISLRALLEKHVTPASRQA